MRERGNRNQSKLLGRRGRGVSAQGLEEVRGRVWEVGQLGQG